MKNAPPQTRFVLDCSGRELFNLLLLFTLPGLLMLACGWWVDEDASMRIACWGFGAVWSLSAGWLITTLALSAHTGFTWSEVRHMPEDWP